MRRDASVLPKASSNSVIFVAVALLYWLLRSLQTLRENEAGYLTEWIIFSPPCPSTSLCYDFCRLSPLHTDGRSTSVR